MIILRTNKYIVAIDYESNPDNGDCYLWPVPVCGYISKEGKFGFVIGIKFLLFGIYIGFGTRPNRNKNGE
jgi:hypothetical protein